MQDTGPWFCPRSMQRLCSRLPHRLVVQGSRGLSRVHSSANGRHRCPACRPRLSATAGPPVGTVGSQASARCASSPSSPTRAPARDALAPGEPTSPSPVTQARGPPLWEMADAEQGEFDPQASPAARYEFAQRIAWSTPHDDDPLGLGKNRLHAGSPASSATAATQGHPRAATPARFTRFVGALSPSRDCSHGPSEPGTLPEGVSNLVSIPVRHFRN